MTWLTFISQMASSLIWPLVVLSCVLVLREPIVKLLADPGLKKIKAWQFEAELDRIRSQTAEQLEAEATTETPRVIESELTVEAKRSPAFAVIEAHKAIERELREILASTGKAPRRTSATGLARLAAEAGLISEMSVRSVEGISYLRNLAVHGGDKDITSDQAVEYVQLADMLLFVIQGDFRRAQAEANAKGAA